MVNRNQNTKTVRCGETFELPVCVSCGNQDLTVERALCGYCSVVHPERLDTIKCHDCGEFKPVTEFDNAAEGIVKRPICFDCESYWDDVYAAELAERAAQGAPHYAYVN